VKKPAFNEDQVLVKVYAASINAGDWHFLTADPFPMRLIGVGLFKPKNTILGADIAGRVEAVGSHPCEANTLKHENDVSLGSPLNWICDMLCVCWHKGRYSLVL
jgi:threonine dehydrogenase-like Zn-dependent dehydrogenase